MVKGIIHFFKSRWYAKPFDIYKECQDNNRLKDYFISRYYISYDNKIYYGNPFLVFFESDQNIWWVHSQNKK
jgi:hypothetical protein